MTKTKLKIIERELFISDLQIPFQDDIAVEIMFDIAKDFKPTLIWLGGDIIDDYSISNYVTSTKIDLVYEFSLAKNFFERIRKEFPNARIYWQEGNHEQRWRYFILKKAPQFEFLLESKLSWDEIFDLKKLKIEYIIGPARVGKLYHLHGHERKYRGQLVHVALNYVRWLHSNIIFGHWHISDSFLIREIDGTYKEAYANPCLFDISKMPYGGYSPVDLNHRGFSLINYVDGGLFHVDRIVLIQSKCGYVVKYKDGLYEYKCSQNHRRVTEIKINGNAK